MNTSVSVGAARGNIKSTEITCAHGLPLGNIVWTSDLPIAMWEIPTQEGKSDVNFIASGRKTLLYVLRAISKR